MTKIPSRPSLEILAWFEEPRSYTQVSRLSGYYRETIWAHMKAARRMGLIAHTGQHKDRLTSCNHKLYELTHAGLEYMEANDG